MSGSEAQHAGGRMRVPACSGMLVQLGQQVKWQGAPALVKRKIPQLIKYHQVFAKQSLGYSPGLAIVLFKTSATVSPLYCTSSLQSDRQL